LRERQQVELQVVMREMPNEGTRSPAPARQHTSPSTGRHVQNSAFGFVVAELTDALAKRLGFEDVKGVLITEVTPDGLAEKKGLRPGLLVRRIENKPITSLADFEAAMQAADPRAGVMLSVRLPDGAQTQIVLKQQ
jgi:serine protease Do